MSMSEERLKKIQEQYSDAIDIALSDGRTLPYYDIDVADMNWLINEIKKLREGMKGATMIANQSGGRIRELEEENKEWQEEYKLIHRSAKDIIEGLEDRLEESELETQRMREALKVIAKETQCDDTWDFANRILDGKGPSGLSYRMGSEGE